MLDFDIEEFFEQLLKSGQLISTDGALMLADCNDLAILQRVSSDICQAYYGDTVTFSKKIFIPLTKLCRNVCHYCTFAELPKQVEAPYMSIDEVIELAKSGASRGCKEALFTLGERPELRYSAARRALKSMGYGSTLEYVHDAAEAVFEQTGLFPHLNVGCMSETEMARLKPVAASMGLMLESASERLCEKGMPHYGSPDKHPKARLATIEAAGKLNIPFTTGILMGIGETRVERIESLLAIRQLHEEYGHIQEVIVQNFRAKPETKMQYAPEPSMAELRWTIAIARIILPPEISLQVPPNLSPGALPALLASGINDWGGVSPLTPDHVNPEAPWPHLDDLSQQTYSAGKYLQERLTVYPNYLVEPNVWLNQRFSRPIFDCSDIQGFAKTDGWHPGGDAELPKEDLERITSTKRVAVGSRLKSIIERCFQRDVLSEKDITHLFESRGDSFNYVCQAADAMRREICGDRVSYVINRNINYTNICYFKCGFCAFSKGKVSEQLREKPYNMGIDEVVNRSQEAWHKGATEVCLQGGIHPSFTGDHYLNICQAVHRDNPALHIHAFSPLEVWHGAQTNDVSVPEFLKQLKHMGLGSLPGTAAEILDDSVRAELCPDKINTQQWLEVIKQAHLQGIRTTSTIMFGHVDTYNSWAKHLLHLLELQKLTGGFTEFVPLPFVAEESPMYKRRYCHKGPTLRESILMHAVARLVFSDFIPNIQASWVKLGEQGLVACLNAGANDAGGTLMNESITRAAGAKHGQLFSPKRIRGIIQKAGREPVQRTTFYRDVSEPVSLINF